MADRAGRGLGGFLASFVATIIFPIQWVRAYRLAGRHLEDDPTGPAKVLAAIVVGLVLAVAGGLALWTVHDSLTEGVYGTLDENLQVEVLEQEYQDQLATIDQTSNQIPTIRRNLATAFATIDDTISHRSEAAGVFEEWERQKKLSAELVDVAEANEPTREARTAYGTTDDGTRLAALRDNWTASVEAMGLGEGDANNLTGALDSAIALPPTLADAYEQQHAARARSQALERHHALYVELQPAIEAQDDDAVRRTIVAFNAGLPEDDDDRIVLEAVDGRFASKDRAIDGMQKFFLYWPIWGWFSLFGLLFGPLAIAMGSILRKAWHPSATVGFRPYPSLSAGLFLILGAFNLPAPFFAAWTFADLEARSIEGQIAL